ncbi:unnamed protein product [Camellia sinensis]
MVCANRSSQQPKTEPSAHLGSNQVHLSISHLSSLPPDLALLENLRISSPPDSNPRSFPYSVKQQCWQKAENVKGRDPDRWSRDALGNTVFRKIVGCPGCLCHDYDHIVPYCKGGEKQIGKLSSFTVQQLIDQREIELRYQKPMLFRKVHTAGFQAFAGLVIPSMVDENDLGALLIGESIIMASGLFLNSSAGRDMDLLELSAYGNVRRGQDSKGCKIQ